MSDRGDVPLEDLLCRFIRGDLMNFATGEPAPEVFAASRRKLSVWHVRLVESATSTMQDLCIESLAGQGEATLTGAEFVDVAEKVRNLPKGDRGNASQREHVRPEPFEVPTIIWRPDEVRPPWARWRDAHANVETTVGKAEFPFAYLVRLAKSCRVRRLPDPPEF